MLQKIKDMLTFKIVSYSEYIKGMRKAYDSHVFKPVDGEIFKRLYG